MKAKLIFIEKKQKTKFFEKTNDQNTKNKTECHFPAPPISNLPFGNIFYNLNLKHAILSVESPFNANGVNFNRFACFKL